MIVMQVCGEHLLKIGKICFRVSCSVMQTSLRAIMLLQLVLPCIIIALTSGTCIAEICLHNVKLSSKGGSFQVLISFRTCIGIAPIAAWL